MEETMFGLRMNADQREEAGTARIGQSLWITGILLGLVLIPLFMINQIFIITVELLNRMAGSLSISYAAANLLVYYIIIPAIWLLLIERIIFRYKDTALGVLLQAAILGYSVIMVIFFGSHNFEVLAQAIFNESVNFLLLFPIPYAAASVLICISLIILITLFLIYHAFRFQFLKPTFGSKIMAWVIITIMLAAGLYELRMAARLNLLYPKMVQQSSTTIPENLIR